jgi:hypothetical protein
MSSAIGEICELGGGGSWVGLNAMWTVLSNAGGSLISDPVFLRGFPSPFVIRVPIV